MGIHGYVTVDIYRSNEDKWYRHCTMVPNLLTNEGRDLYHAQCYQNTSAGTRGTNYMALSSDTAAVAATHTATGTAAGNWDATSMEITATGLARVATLDSITHTAGTNSTLLDHTFTNTSGGAVSDIQKVGIFNDADASGTEKLGHEASFTAATLQNNDKIRIQYTLNLG